MDIISFVTTLVLMRLHLSFTRRWSISLSELGHFEKQYGFIGLVGGETASI